MKIKFRNVTYWHIKKGNGFFKNGELIVEIDSDIDIDIEELGYEFIEEEQPWVVDSFCWEIIEAIK